MRAPIALMLLTLFLLPAPFTAQQQPSEKQSSGASDILDEGVQIRLRQGTLYLLGDAPIQVRNMSAVLQPGSGPQKNGDGSCSCTSSNLIVGSGQVILPSQTLTKVMNEQMSGEDSGLQDLEFSTEGSEVKIEGTMDKVVAVPFTVSGPIETTPEGKVRIHSASIKAGSIPLGGLMDIFGVSVEDVAGEIKQPALQVVDDTLVIHPERLSQRLRLWGEVSQVEVLEDGLLLTFGSEQSQAAAASGRSADDPSQSDSTASADRSELPETGGSGGMLAIAGLAAAVLGAVLLRRKRRS